MSIGPLMVDLEGLTLTQEDEILLSNKLVGGVILFARNFKSPPQLIDLISAIRHIRNTDFLIAVDQEGGRVQRFKDGFTSLPPAAWYGRSFEHNPEQALRLCEEGGWLMATELRSVDVDFSFAPVLDLGYGPGQVIGNRAFAGEALVVAKLTAAWMRGVKSAGMANVGKHFPGHGAVQADSHLELPIDERPFEMLLEADLIPFEYAIKAGLDAIMPAHVLYTQIDTNPAGFSKLWLETILRSKLGFQGVIFSDDLSMGAAQVAGGYSARAQAALAAGCDMILACNNRPGVLEIVEALADYTNPTSQQRLLRMQASSGPKWAEVHANPRWHEAVAAITV